MSTDGTRVVFRRGDAVKEAFLKPGQRVLAAGYMLGYDETGFGECGGSCICSTCHVRLVQGAFPPPKPGEVALLDTVPVVYANSRLACQLLLAGQPLVEVEWVG